MNWLLFIVIFVIVGCAIGGYRKGLIKVVFSLASSLLALILVGLLSPFVGNFIQEHTSMRTFVQEKSSAMVAEWNQNQDASTEAGRLAAIDHYEIPDFLKSYLKSGHTADAMKQGFNDFISGRIADMVISITAFIATYLVMLLILHVLAQVLDLMAKLPVLKSVNRIGGLAAGLLEGLLSVWIFFLLLTFLCTIEFGKLCMQMIAHSQILSWLFDKNPLMLLLP